MAQPEQVGHSLGVEQILGSDGRSHRELSLAV
jgi:hypothetical protein